MKGPLVSDLVSLRQTLLPTITGKVKKNENLSYCGSMQLTMTPTFLLPLN
jgi:hypothetical protein